MFKPFILFYVVAIATIQVMGVSVKAEAMLCQADGHAYSEGFQRCAPAFRSDGGGPVVLYCFKGEWTAREIGPNHIDTCARCTFGNKNYSEGAVVTDKRNGITQRCNGGTWAWLSSPPVHGQKIRFSISARNDQPFEPSKSIVLPAGNWVVKIVEGDYQTWSGDTNKNKFCISFFVASDEFDHSPGYGHGAWGNKGICKVTPGEALAAAQDMEFDLKLPTAVTFSILNSPHDNSGGLSFELNRTP